MEVEKFQKVRLAALGKFKRSRTNGDASLYETDKTVDVVRPSSFRTQEKNGRTELLSMTEESLKGLAKTYPHYGPIDNPRAAANAICKACEWRQEVVAAVFQDVIAMLKAGKKVGSITGLLVTRARRYQQDRKAATAGAGA